MNHDHHDNEYLARNGVVGMFRHVCLKVKEAFKYLQSIYSLCIYCHVLLEFQLQYFINFDFHD